MHGAAQSAVEAGGAGEYFRKGAVKQEVYCKILNIALFLLAFLNYLEDVSAQEFFHNIVKLVIVKLLDGGKSFCKDLAVAAVRAEGEIVDVKAICLTDRACLLTDGQVCGAGVVIFYSVIYALGLYLVEHGLKLADNAHIAVDTQKIVFGIELFLLRKGL